VAENDHLPLTWHIALTTVYALTCYTVIQIWGQSLPPTYGSRDIGCFGMMPIFPL